jgi:phosphate-selective porin OprO/OprP
MSRTHLPTSSLNSRRKSSQVAVLAALALLPFGFAAGVAQAAPASADEVAALREQIRQLDQKLRILERNAELKDEAAAADAAKAVKPAADAKGFGLVSGDKAFDLRFKFLGQFDARTNLDHKGVANRDQFLIRRARVWFQGTVASIYDFAIVPEFQGGSNSSSSVSIVDAWIAARVNPAFGVKAGKFASAVGLEPGGNRHFIEAPFVNTLLPNRDLGVEIFGRVADDYVEYRAGVFTGAPNNTTNFGGNTPDLADGDRSFAGRVTVYPFKANKDSALATLGFGLGGSIGNDVGDGAIGGTSGLTNISTNGQQTLISFRSASTGNGVIAAGRHLRLSPSLEWYTGTPWSVAAEYAYEFQRYRRYTGAVANNNLEGSNKAWRTSVGYVLTGEAATKNGVTPAVPFKWGSGNWGAFELVGRVSGLDVADELFQTAALNGGVLSRTTNATGGFAYGVGVNWYPSSQFRVLFNVEKTELRDGGAGTAGALSDELYAFTRLQLSF